LLIVPKSAVAVFDLSFRMFALSFSSVSSLFLFDRASVILTPVIGVFLGRESLRH